MSLAAGTRLGPYEVLGLIGAGGMGEVYNARDTRLDRTVAIKILPAELGADPDRRTRFEREARTIASLTHPNICTLYDVGASVPANPESRLPRASVPPGESRGIPTPQSPIPNSVLHYLVMELLSGETLAERLRKGPLTIEQALVVVTEIADALAAAHRHGVVHRDLKPGNVMLTKTGAKLLDFGLAKLTGHAEQPAAAHLESALTRERPLTGEGVILGTVQYMAPEQVEGKEADARTDLWALGALLYEMLTGKRAFEGASAASLIGAILEREPAPISTLLPLTPPGVDRLVRQCLAKAPDDRPDTAHDVANVLRGIRETSVVSLPAGDRTGHPRGTRLARGVAVAALLVAAFSTTIAAVLWIRSSRPPLQRAPVRFSLSDRLPTAANTDPQPLFAVSSDGQRVVFVGDRDGVACLYLRELRALEAKVIPGTDEAMEPFFSPDGQRIGFFAGGKLKVLSLAGGAPEDRAQIAWPRGGTWTMDDLIIYSPSDNAGLWQVPAAGGAARVLAQPDPAKGERSYRWPAALPGGDAVLFTVATSDIQSFDEARLVVRSLRTGEQREVVRGGSFGTCTATGHLLFARAGALMAAPFDAARRMVTGDAKPVVDGLVTHPVSGAAQYAVGADGTLVYVAGQALSRQATLTWVDAAGKTTRLATPPAAYQAVSVAPDGRSAALDIDGANANIWLLDLARTSMTRLTFEWSNNAPFWTPDGSRVCFASERGGIGRFFRQAADGASAPEPLTPARPSRILGASWAPGGRVLIFSELGERSGWDILTQAMPGDGNPRPFLKTPFNEENPRFSPDGRWVAYESDESGRTEVYALPFPGPGRKWLISTDGGVQPLWARDGRELYYRNGDAIMAVAVQTSPSWSPARPRLLFRKALRTAPLYPYDVGPNRQFLMIEPLPPPVIGPVTIVLNWFEELKARVPHTSAK